MRAHIRHVLAAALAITVVAIPSAQDAPQDYPQWRGRGRDGSASGFVEPRTWPDTLTRRWIVEIGEGYATPLVGGRTIYTFTRRGDDEVMAALEAASGKTIWQTAYPAPYKVAEPAAKHGLGPKATPLLHRGKLYTLGNSGIVSAFDAANGRLLWQKPAPAEYPLYGTAVSPVGDKDLVILQVGDNGPLTAVDENTGAIKWTWSGPGPGYASPMIVDLGGERQVIQMTRKGVVSVALEDGAPLWDHPFASPSAPPSSITPILHGDTIIVGGPTMGIAALRPVRRGVVWTVDVVWETKEVSMFMSNPVLVRDTLFGLSEKASGQFFALDARTGKVLWLGPPRAAANTAIIKAGALLFLLNDSAELIVAKASTTGFEPVKRYTVADSATWAQPAISGARLFVKDVRSLALWTVN